MLLFGTPKRLVLTASLVIVIFLASCFVYYVASPTIYWYRRVSSLAASEQKRELILRSIDNINRDAPIEPRSGDIYFPEVRLYLPRPSEPVRLAYAYLKDGDTTEISVVNRPIYDRLASKLIAANTTEEFFEQLPKLQACSRGVVLTYDKEPAYVSGPLKETIQLSNGKTLYAFTDEACDENGGTARLLRGLKPY